MNLAIPGFNRNGTPQDNHLRTTMWFARKQADRFEALAEDAYNRGLFELCDEYDGATNAWLTTMRGCYCALRAARPHYSA